jgi:hypothetical protein
VRLRDEKRADREGDQHQIYNLLRARRRGEMRTGLPGPGLIMFMFMAMSMCIHVHAPGWHETSQEMQCTTDSAIVGIHGEPPG